MKSVKKMTALIMMFALMLTLFMFPQVSAYEDGMKSEPANIVSKTLTGMPVVVNSKSAILMDAATGKVLMKSNEHLKVFPASVTKIMPLLLFAEAIDNGKISLTDKVTCSDTAASKGGSQIWLKEGEVMTVDDLLKATAIYSANDACTALGEHIAGSNEAFIDMMNARAKQLGMDETNFDNCTGLDDKTDTHLTSAYDIAVMSRELLKHEIVLNYTTIWMDSLRNGQTELVNTNKLVRFYEGITGLKTGTTNKAGCCLSATAKRDGTHLIAVVMGSATSNDRFNGAKAMLNWGFANYKSRKPVIDKKLITKVHIIKGVEEFVLPEVPELTPILIQKGKEDKISTKINLAVDVEAPIEKGQVLGKAVVTVDNEVVAEYNLTSPMSVDKLSFGFVFKRLLGALMS